MINALIVSFTLLAAADLPQDAAPVPATPPRVAAVNAPTEAAEAVYIADAAAMARGQRSRLAVLGTPHLSSLPEGFDMARFRPLIDRLEAWAPERIAIESLSGAECDFLRARTFAYPDTANQYCPDPTEARTALGLTGAEAEAEIEHILATPMPDRQPGERRRLAGLFLAAGDTSSAVVQWLRLPIGERTAGDGLTEALAAYLDTRTMRRNENVVIAAALAAELGHDRLYPVDDHTGDRATGPLEEETYGAEIMAIWNNPYTNDRIATMGAAEDRIVADPAASVLDWYRTFNSAEQARYAVAGDFAAAAGADTPYKSGRKYLAYWETRNLRMAANIREVIGADARVLAIVGASHKPYYERYLGVTSDVEIIDINTLLK